MTNLPMDVIKIKQAVLCDPEDIRIEVAKKLIVDTPELVAMWHSLERNKHPDDPDYEWVWAFLNAATEASSLPRYQHKSKTDKNKLSKDIMDMATRLSMMLKSNGLDAHLVHRNGVNFNGFYFYEDFSYSNQAGLDAERANKLKMSDAIERIAKRAQQKIANEPMPGKAGANAAAIRFIRIIADRNQQWYGTPLNAVTATAANAIFGTTYVESDIRNLLVR
jgi:hypothetical protein